MRVLITGAAGRLGQRLSKALESDHDLVLVDKERLDDPRFAHVDVTNLPAVRAAMQRCDAVVHMAILDWATCGAMEALRYGVPCVQVHVAGLHNVLQAAVEADVCRFVYTSSVSAVDGLPAGTKVDSDTRHYSNAVYGLTKGFGEDLCRMFHSNFGLPVAVLRLGTVFTPDGEGAWIGNVYHPDLGNSSAPETATSRVHLDDVTRAIALALQAAQPAYAMVHVVGADSGGHWDLAAAWRAFGWAPRYAFGRDGLPCEAPQADPVPTSSSATREGLVAAR